MAIMLGYKIEQNNYPLRYSLAGVSRGFFIRPSRLASNGSIGMTGGGFESCKGHCLTMTESCIRLRLWLTCYADQWLKGLVDSSGTRTRQSHPLKSAAIFLVTGAPLYSDKPMHQRAGNGLNDIRLIKQGEIPMPRPFFVRILALLNKVLGPSGLKRKPNADEVSQGQSIFSSGIFKY